MIEYQLRLVHELFNSNCENPKKIVYAADARLRL